MSIPKPETEKTTSVKKQTAAALDFPPIKRRQGRFRGILALYQSFASALQALRANKLRSLLTTLGIIIGVAAVIMMVANSESTSTTIRARLSNLNPNELIIFPGSSSSGGVRGGAGTQQTLTQADADAIATVPDILVASPIINSSGQVVYSNQNWSTRVSGVYPNFDQVGSWQMQEGNFFTQQDEQSGTAVAVIGQTIVDNLFQGADPMGQQIRIRSVPFTVVGVLASKGASGFGNQDDIIYVPFTTAQQRLTGGTTGLGSVQAIVDSDTHINDAQAAIQQLLEQRHNISNPLLDDFTIQNQSQVLQSVQAASQQLTSLLISVASISLVVGGIGIMNIMLVSVTERTREIGIRIAIGAHPGDVMMQFLIEALILSALGGLVGIAGGVAGAYISTKISGNPFVIDPLAMLVAFGFSALIGIVFGFYPAQRAARLDPIVALRTE